MSDKARKQRIIGLSFPEALIDLSPSGDLNLGDSIRVYRSWPLPQPNDTQKMILEFLFDAYPEKVSGNALAKAFPDNHQFKVELAYLIGKGFVKYVPIASEKKWKGRVEKFNASWMGVGKKAFTGTSYEIAVEGIDLLRSQLQSKTKTALTKKQKEKAVPLPIPKKVCLHKKTHLVEIQQGSVITVGGGLSVLKAERTQPKFLSFHECDDCGAVFYKEVQSMDARQAD